MLNQIIQSIKKRLGLLFLILILLIISIASIKPQFYLLGWDNYSSYFNLKTNIFRTFFATWREYRGLGVPSDAEATDIFRQLFFYILHFIIPEALLDQVYYIFALWVGILGMYFFVELLAQKFYFKEQLKTEKWQDFFATVASLFYLFNLNTLSVFYSPIIPYINRFYSLPLTLYLLLKFITSNYKKRDFIILALTVIVTSGSYITPTVFITSFIAFFIFFLVNLDIKKILLFSFTFLILNAFWILPFLNYTFQKSSLIPLARTFIEINESTLNRSKNDFSLEKQSIFYPSFFDMGFPSINGKKQLIHPLLAEYQKPLSKTIFLFFPVLYGLGAAIIIIFWRKNKQVLWIPLWIFLFLFLSAKEYSPIGFIYVWLKRFIPYFDIIFRIADTKFHAYISFAGSIAGAYGIVYILSILQKKLIFYSTLIIFTLVSFTYVFLFRSYFNSNLINSLVYTKIPKAYFEIADKINSDPKRVRVLHLPFDSWHHYWRSFSWGYLGSAFFNFFFNKPYIDKTFEPASMENSYLHSKINLLLDSFYRSSNDLDKQQLALRFLKLLQETGIKYVLVDHSISAEIYVRNLLYTAKQSTIKAQEMMDYLYKENNVRHVNTYSINLSDLYSDYQKLYPTNITGLPDNLPSEAKIDLYEIDTTQPVFSFVSAAKSIDPKLDNLLETDIDTMFDEKIVQNEKKPTQFFPFIQQNHKVLSNEKEIVLQYPNIIESLSKYNIVTSPSEIDSYLVDVYGKIINKDLKLSFYHRYYPDIGGKQFKKYIGSIEIALPDKFKSDVFSSYFMGNSLVDNASRILDSYRLKLNDVFVPPPSNISEQEQYITSYMLHEKIIRATILSKTATQNLDLKSFNKVESVCSIELENKTIKMDFCDIPSFFQLPVVPLDKTTSNNQYLEVELIAKGDVNNASKNYDSPIHGYVCIHQEGNKDCLNLHRNFQVFKNPSSYRVPTQDLIAGKLPPIIDIGSIPFDNVNQTILVEGVTQHFYQPLQEKTLPFIPDYPQVTVDLSGNLQISVPKAVSPHAYFHKPDFELYDNTLEPCQKNGKSNRTIRFSKDRLFNQMENCNMTFAQIFNFSFQYPIFISFDYWRGSGQQPMFNLSKKGDLYLIERVSLYQGYPNLKGMGENIKLTTGSRLIAPRFTNDSYSSKISANFSQDTANEGLFALGSFQIIEYPVVWNSLVLKPIDGSEKKYITPDENFSFRHILPSLWKIDFQKQLKVSKNNQEKSLLLFNEGFDQQWRLYDSIWNLLIGKEKAKALKCDGYANCFEIEPKSGVYYIFYTPEKLSFLGWGITVLAVFLLAKVLLTKSIKEIE